MDVAMKVITYGAYMLIAWVFLQWGWLMWKAIRYREAYDEERNREIRLYYGELEADEVRTLEEAIRCASPEDFHD